MYTTSDKEFVLFPCSGSKLTEGRLFSPSANLEEKDADKLSLLMTDCSYFSEVQRFSNLISNEKMARNYLREFFNEFKLANNDSEIYKGKKAIKIPYIKSIHAQLTKTFT